jgi:hypothetical protein
VFKSLFVALFVTALIVFPGVVRAETAQGFVKRYVETVDGGVSSAEFSKFWYKGVRDNLHNTPEGLKKEHALAKNIHEILIRDGGWNDPVVTPWNDSSQTTGLTFKLNTPIDNDDMIPNLRGASPETVFTEYQITIEMESGRWVVSGESFVGVIE